MTDQRPKDRIIRVRVVLSVKLNLDAYNREYNEDVRANELRDSFIDSAVDAVNQVIYPTAPIIVDVTRS